MPNNDGRADKGRYRHDSHADKNPYRHDRRADSLSQCFKPLLHGLYPYSGGKMSCSKRLKYNTLKRNLIPETSWFCPKGLHVCHSKAKAE